MSKIKRMTAVLLSVIMLVCMFSVPTGAASTKSELIDVALNSVIKDATSIVNLGQGLYCVNTVNGSDIYRIGEDELKTWRNSGKLTPKKVTLSSDIPEDAFLKCEEYFTSSKGYAVISYYYYENENYYHFVKAVKYDKSSNKLTTVYNIPSDEQISGMTNDGYMSMSILDENYNQSIKIVSPNGKTIKTIKAANFSGFTWTSKYGYYIKYKNDKYTLYRYDTSGKTKKISKTYSFIEIVYAWYGSKAYPVGYIYSTISSDNYDEKNPNRGVYFATFDGKFTAKISQSFKVSYDKKYSYGFEPSVHCKYLNGSIAVLTLLAKDEYYPYANPGSSYGTILVSLKNNKFNVLNNDYMEYSTEDGKIFTVSNYKNDKQIYGYINNKGKKLAYSFDSAADFAKSAKYSVVMKNGSAYVIDRKMNKVSESLKLKNTDSLQLFNETGTLWSYTTKDGVAHLVTYKGAIAA